MEDKLIEFETAKLASEAGYDITPDWVYDTDGILSTFGSFIGDDEIFAPTQSLLQRWLREVHNINIFMSHKPNIKKWDFIPTDLTLNGKDWVKANNEYYKTRKSRSYDTYEEALEAGLQEALKLIKT